MKHQFISKYISLYTYIMGQNIYCLNQYASYFVLFYVRYALWHTFYFEKLTTLPSKINDVSYHQIKLVKISALKQKDYVILVF